MYISNIRIRNYKNFYKCSIELQKDITTIIGENGTGKTNLFYALKFLLDKNNRHSLDESDFSYELDKYKGHWIIISVNFKDVPDSEETPEAVEFSADDNKDATYSLIFRPNKIIRNTLFNMSKEFVEEIEEEKKLIKKMELENYLDNINIKSDYEVIKTVGNIFDFLDEDSYKKIVGNFDEMLFPSPDDEQENSVNIGDRVENHVNNFISVTFIPAIRDVNGELVRDGNFFEKMLGTISENIDEVKWNDIKNNFDTINIQLKSIDEYNEFTDNILTMMKNTVGASFSGDMFLDVSVPEEKNNVIKYFTLKGRVEDHNVDLYNKSLGENNVIYFALKMLQNNYNSGHTKKLFNLLIIEEPESHLHKHLQQTFFKGIGKTNDSQILLSTHSVHVSESCNISSMIVLGKKSEKSSEVYMPSYNLNSSEVKYLERYLDSTRSPILFSKNVMLVEGTAELIFIDYILKIKYDFDLNAYGISLVSMDNCFFEKMSKLFHKDRLRKKCSIITDLDKSFNGEKKLAEELSKNRVEKLNDIHFENDYVNVYTNDYTFEIEVFSNNIELFSQYIQEKEIYTNGIKKAIDELVNPNIIDERYSRILKVAETLGKGWLALDFTEWLQSKDKNVINDFEIPTYIIDSLKNFFPSEIYNISIYKQIVENYCRKYNIDDSEIKDEFIIYIKELCNEK